MTIDHTDGCVHFVDIDDDNNRLHQDNGHNIASWWNIHVLHSSIETGVERGGFEKEHFNWGSRFPFSCLRPLAIIIRGDMKKKPVRCDMGM